MNEIEELYENVGIEKCNNKIKEIFPNVCDKNCEDCENNWYPDFDAEKQIELIKWLGIRDEFNFYQNKITKDWVFYDHEKDATHYNFELGLASWVNYLWQDLTKEEKEQIRSVLNG